jgi:hypothetical protein
VFLHHFDVLKVEIKWKGFEFFAPKHPSFAMFGSKVIRHIKMAIRHMWRVANGLGNADLVQQCPSKMFLVPSYSPLL